MQFCPFHLILFCKFQYLAFVEIHARNMLSFIKFGQMGNGKMFKQMFDARWTLSVTIAHVDSLGQVSKNDWSFSLAPVY